jgi:hypothetical protein
MAGLVLAAENREWKKVEVRRPLEADFSSERGPSREAFVASWIRPCFAESSPYVRHPSGDCDCDCACRRSSVPVTTPILVTRTLPCHVAASHNFSPPPSRFRDFLKFGTFGGCASGERDGEYSEIAQSTLGR